MDRSKFLECMAWCGTGVLYALGGPKIVGRALADAAPAAAVTRSFVQISDTHIGFHGNANGDVIATFQAAIDKINALPNRPEFVMHTGDVSHLSKPEQFDTVRQMLGTIRTGAIYSVPGEHDVIDDNGALYFKMFGRGAQPWYSFDAAGVHALALTNVINIAQGGMLGRDQLEWARADLAKQRSNTPIVVFAHIPLYAAYPAWGWTTDDYLELLSTKVDGNVTFFTADSTAFPQPKPGSAPNPGPLKVPAGELGTYLGIRIATLARVPGPIAVADETLAQP
jgi:Icc protein